MLIGTLLSVAAVRTASAQATPDASSPQFVVHPDSLSMTAGETARLEVQWAAEPNNGRSDSVFYFSGSQRAVSIDSTGLVEAHRAGDYELYVLVPRGDGSAARRTVPVHVAPAPIDLVQLRRPPRTLYAGATYRLRTRAVDVRGTERPDAPIRFSSSDPAVAQIDSAGHVLARRPGTVTLAARSGSARAELTATVNAHPVRSVDLTVEPARGRTGDVIHARARPLDVNGDLVEDAPVRYSFNAHPDDSLAPGTTAQIADDGRFVASEPGWYTLVARSGRGVAERRVRVEPRDLKGQLEVVGRGPVRDVHTSDLWVWEGIDGRDYAVTGTWGGRGEAYFWDVTDPADIRAIDTVQVDARTVNDVKVAEDGRLAVITREGASDRENGIVLLDVSDPSEVELIAEHTDELTGGVHNAFIHEGYVYAVSNARRIEIVDVSESRSPETVAQFELETPGHSVHDVWVKDGIAYTSNWADGVVAIDVGNGIAGGSPTEPIEISRYSYPNPWAHAAFPYRDEKDDRFYVIVGDEAFPNGLNVVGQPTIPAGWLHFVDFSQWDRPKEVARYRIPGAGTHNFWVRDDTLYVAYYNAGLRVVDLSGELMGNLWEQGREIDHFVPTDPQAVVPNAAMTWGPQPHKGVIFISDWNSGLWALRLTSNDQ